MDMFEIAVSLLTLVIIEIILGVDNLIFLIILASKLPKAQQKKARQVGLTVAWVTRLILLFSAVWIATLNKPIFHLADFGFSGRDLFLLLGGIFLIAKATREIHFEMIHNYDVLDEVKIKGGTFKSVVFQIGLMDIIFSLDSVLTAVALTKLFWVMATAITIAIIVMIVVSEPVGKFIEKNPTIKMLALSFLILIGTVLIADGFHFHIPRGYVYFAITFSLTVEALNLLKRNKVNNKKLKSTKLKSTIEKKSKRK